MAGSTTASVTVDELGVPVGLTRSNLSAEAVQVRLGSSTLTLPVPSKMTTLDCFPLDGAAVCIVDGLAGVGHTVASIFVARDQVLAPVLARMDSFGVPQLQPLTAHQLLLVSWTTPAGLGDHPETVQAWQTWVVTASGVTLTGCGPFSRPPAPPFPDVPQTGNCSP